MSVTIRDLNATWKPVVVFDGANSEFHFLAQRLHSRKQTRFALLGPCRMVPRAGDNSDGSVAHAADNGQQRVETVLCLSDMQPMQVQLPAAH